MPDFSHEKLDTGRETASTADISRFKMTGTLMGAGLRGVAVGAALTIM